MVMLWWYWIVLGLALIAFELVIPSFTIIWFGAAAILVGILHFIFPATPLALQIFIWTVLSILCAVAWFRYFKPTTDRTKSGLSKEAVLGHTGIVIKPSEANGKGVVKFQVPLMGDDEWVCFADESLQIGDRVRVVDVEGHALKVARN